MLPLKSPDDGSDEPLDTVAIVADALRAKFGADAADVAAKQCDLASDDSTPRWKEILLRLKD